MRLGQDVLGLRASLVRCDLAIDADREAPLAARAPSSYPVVGDERLASCPKDAERKAAQLVIKDVVTCSSHVGSTTFARRDADCRGARLGLAAKLTTDRRKHPPTSISPGYAALPAQEGGRISV
jgi:hypothetical protein